MNDEEAVIKDLEKSYARALRDIETKIKILQADEMTQSKIYQVQYQKALKAQIEGIMEKLHGDNYTSVQQYLNECYKKSFVGTMYALHGQGMPVLAPIDQDAAVHAVMLDSHISGSLYEAMGVDTAKLKQAIRREISTGISTGASYDDIARNLRFATNAPLARTKTIVRTEGHRVQQASAADARNEAKKQGCDVLKQWDSTLDGNTRPTHRELDGQIRETDEPFEVDGKKADRPGEFGRPEEDINCRCAALTRARWGLDESELQTMKDRAKFFELDKTKNFQEFSEKYLKASEESYRMDARNFVPAKSIKEAESFARDTLGLDCSYKGVDVKCANDMNAAFQRGLAYCPEIKDRLNFVGSAQERNSRFKAELIDFFTEDLKKRYPGQTDDWYRKYAKSFAGQTVGRVDGKTYAFASRANKDSPDVVRKYTGIVVNNKWGKDVETFVKALESDVKVGWHPIGCGTIASVFDHEIAHQIDYATGLRDNQEMKALWASLGKEDVEKGLSRYAATNINEFIAEGYAEYCNSKEPREIAKKIGSIIKKAVGKK